VAISALTGEAHTVTADDLEEALAVPADDWVAATKSSGRLARIGVLVSDDDDDRLAELRRRDEALTALGWEPAAALFHRTSRTGRANALTAGTGEPPTAFHERAGPRIDLPSPSLDGSLESTLARRHTARAFDEGPALPVELLGSILYRVFGARATASLPGGVTGLRKSSPSGGALHPLEAYPLVRRVEGLPTGLYHYSVARHGLSRVRTFPEPEVRALAERATAGQSWAASAQALIVLTARFGRSFWKYREHARAYAVVLMDAGHLAQTFYLVCTELGLGPFVTAAIDAAAIDEALEIDGFTEGAIAVCGCGIRAPAPPELEPAFEPYAPDGA
jgi:putative peptide maturation dehydrogenase